MKFLESVSRARRKLKNRSKEHKHKRGGGSRNDNHGGEKCDAEGSGTGQSSSIPPKAEGVAESGPSGEKRHGDEEGVVQVDPPTSVTSISPGDDGELKGARAVFI